MNYTYPFATCFSLHNMMLGYTPTSGEEERQRRKRDGALAVFVICISLRCGWGKKEAEEKGQGRRERTEEDRGQRSEANMIWLNISSNREGDM